MIARTRFGEPLIADCVQLRYELRLCLHVELTHRRAQGVARSRSRDPEAVSDELMAFPESGIRHDLAFAVGEASRVYDAGRIGHRQDVATPVGVKPFDHRPRSNAHQIFKASSVSFFRSGPRARSMRMAASRSA